MSGRLFDWIISIWAIFSCVLFVAPSAFMGMGLGSAARVAAELQGEAGPVYIFGLALFIIFRAVGALRRSAV